MTHERFLERAYALQGPDDARVFYDEWAPKYNESMETFAYTLPKQAVSTFLQYNDRKQNADVLRIIDLGCGTGLAGRELAAKGFRNVEGVDISPEMVADASRCGAYVKVSVADLSKPIDRANGSYDAIVCVGTLTTGHLKSTVLDEFVRILRPHGLLVATITDKVWEEEYASKILEMDRNDSIGILSQQVVGVVEGQTTGARVVVLQKQGI